MATPRAVRIPRSRPSPAVRASVGPEEDEPRDEGARPRRPNVGGSQRATRLAALFVAVLAVLFVGFLLYARTVPGGTAPAASNGLLLFSGMFVGFAVVGVVYTLHPAPRAVEVEADHVTVVGRWGRRLRLPSLERLSVSVVRRYPAGWLASTPVELIELWGEGVPNRSYLVESDLFAGANVSARRR